MKNKLSPFSKFSSQVRSIKIFLPGYSFSHKTSLGERDVFIGRELIKDKLYCWLTNASKSGSYLVTGYRGMGKTSFVNKVIDGICRKKNSEVEIFYYLSAITIILWVRMAVPVVDTDPTLTSFEGLFIWIYRGNI